MGKILKINKRRALIKDVERGKKNPKLINLGPTFIPDYSWRLTIKYIFGPGPLNSVHENSL